MDVSRLTKDELLHEVGIRGQKLVSEETTVGVLRTSFRELRAREEGGEDLEDVLIPVDVEEELLIIETKLQEANALLAEFPETESEATRLSKATRIRTITSHLGRRTVRLLSHANGSARDPVKVLLRNLKDFVERFRGAGDSPVYNASSVYSVSSVRSSGTKPSLSVKDEGEGGKPKGPKGGPGSSRNSPPKFYKWKIHFSGEEGSSALGFILDIEEKATYEQVDFNMLITGATEFFTGEAKTWYRSVKNKIDSWNELKIALKREYLPLDYYDNLLEEIRARKQGPTETVGTFVANMLALFGRLEMEAPVAEEIQLNIILKNLSPFYTESLALTKVMSIEQLRTLGKQLEVSRMRVESYEGKVKPRKMEPEFAVKPSRTRKPVVSEVDEVSEVTAGRDEPVPPQKPPPVKANTDAKAKSSKLTCWKCGVQGHRHSECPSDIKKVFCYRCGMKEVTVRNCPRCRRKGEGQ